VHIGYRERALRGVIFGRNSNVLGDPASCSDLTILKVLALVTADALTVPCAERQSKTGFAVCGLELVCKDPEVWLVVEAIAAWFQLQPRMRERSASESRY